jgi:hypothetical protein
MSMPVLLEDIWNQMRAAGIVPTAPSSKDLDEIVAVTSRMVTCPDCNRTAIVTIRFECFPSLFGEDEETLIEQGEHPDVADGEWDIRIQWPNRGDGEKQQTRARSPRDRAMGAVAGKGACQSQSGDDVDGHVEGASRRSRTVPVRDSSGRSGDATRSTDHAAIPGREGERNMIGVTIGERSDQRCEGCYREVPPGKQVEARWGAEDHTFCQMCANTLGAGLIWGTVELVMEEAKISP